METGFWPSAIEVELQVDGKHISRSCSGEGIFKYTLWFIQGPLWFIQGRSSIERPIQLNNASLSLQSFISDKEGKGQQVKQGEFNLIFGMSSGKSVNLDQQIVNRKNPFRGKIKWFCKHGCLNNFHFPVSNRKWSKWLVYLKI